MGRPPKFSCDEILDVTARLIAENGLSHLTVAAVAGVLGAPSGSIYHRFESRDLLLASLWVRTAKRAQEGFVAALAHDDVEQAALSAAVHIPRWSRANLDDARVMLLHRRQDLAGQWPVELGKDLAELRQTIEKAIRVFAQRRFSDASKRSVDIVSFALLDVPYAAVRRHLLVGKRPPKTVDDLVVRTCRCLLF